MKVGVLMGGISSEREISLLSGQEIIKNLDKAKYEVFPIVINSKDEVLEKVKGFDFIFLALHGIFGEDGTIQALLNSVSIPYSGCDMLTSAICMNKAQTKRILKAEGIKVPPSYTLYKNKAIDYTLLETLSYPMIVKPNNGGSSIGTSLVHSKSQLTESIKEAFKYDDKVLVEKYIKGEEYTAPILNNEVLTILSIKPSESFFNYSSKYKDGGAEELKANLSKALEEKIIDISKKCWEILECKAYVRVDMIVSDNIPYVLELNTLPGMTKNSLFPKSAALSGMSYNLLLDNIIKYSIEEIKLT